MAGRPRSRTVQRSVLDAAVALTREVGYAQLTIEAIAGRAGVSKQTIYRWWPGKAPILLEALAGSAAAIAPDPDTGSLESDLREFVRRSVAGAGAGNRDLLTALMAEAQLDEDFAAEFERGFLGVRRRVLSAILERAAARGELRTRDPGFVAELVFGALWYRMLTRRRLDRRFADQLTETVLGLG